MTRSYRFGDFRLDPATRELHRGDITVPVPPRAFDCIVYLVEQRERAVGRDELIAAVWGKADVSDGLLGQTILAARRALEDTGKEQHCIRTVIRFGYHWIAPVEAVDATVADQAARPAARTTPTTEAQVDTAAEPDATLAPAATAAKVPRPRPRLRLVVAAAIALGALATVATFLWWQAERGSSTPSATTSTQSRVLLVLPVTLNAGDGYAWVRLGLMDLIAQRLRATGMAVVPSDNVVALTSRRADGATTPDPATLAQTAGADLVIAAQAELIAQRWRVSLRAVHGEPALLASGESSDVLGAARIATDRLAQQLGHAPPNDAGTTVDAPELASLLQQVEAAILGDRLDSARALLAGLAPAQRELPQVRLRQAQIDYQAGDFAAAENAFNAILAAVPAEQDPVLRARAGRPRHHRRDARQRGRGDAALRRRDRPAARCARARRARPCAQRARQCRRAAGTLR